MVHLDTMPDDSQLPQLQLACDVTAMKEIFQRRFPGYAEGRWRIDGLQIEQFYYKPGKKCEVYYSLQVTDLTVGRTGNQILFAVISPNGEAEARYGRAQHESHFQPEFGPAIGFLPELSMVLWGFPNDPRLKQLPRLLDAEACAKIFRSHWPTLRLPTASRLVEVATELVRYVPSDRCTLRHQVRLNDGSELVIYSKTFGHKTAGTPIFNAMQTLWNAPVSQSGEVIIPEPVFLAEDMNTIFMRGLNGENVDDLLAKLDLDRAAAEIGGWLAGIHQCRIEGLSSHSDQDLMARVAKVEKMLERCDSDCTATVAAIYRKLREKYSSLTPIAPTPIHGGFRLSQLLRVDGKFAVIDFDDFKQGNPILDVANFVAHLFYLPLREKLTQEQSRSAIHHFCQAYADAAPWGLPADVLAWHTAAQLVGSQAKKCLNLAKSNHEMKVAYLVDLARDILDGKERLIG